MHGLVSAIQQFRRPTSVRCKCTVDDRRMANDEARCRATEPKDGIRDRRSAVLEYAARGIRINAVSPGTIETPMVAEMLPKEPHSSTESAPTPPGQFYDVRDGLQRLAPELRADGRRSCSQAF